MNNKDKKNLYQSFMKDIEDMRSLLERCIWVANFEGAINDEIEEDARKVLDCLINCAIEKGKKRLLEIVKEDDIPKNLLFNGKEVELEPIVDEDGWTTIYY